MDLLGTLEVLVRVVETGSFSSVARECGLTQAAVSKQIAKLEEHFGVRLVHRSTRKLSLTDDGQVLLGLTRPVLDGIEGIKAALGRRSASAVGLVRVGVNATVSRFFAPRLPSLLVDYPGLKVELVVNDRFGDMFEDRLDIALRLGEITDESLVIYAAGSVARVAVASPSYIAEFGKPSTPASLGIHTCIIHDVGRDSNVWSFSMPEGVQGFRVSGGFLANDGRAVHLAARAGYGIAFLSPLEVFDDLRNGELVRVLSAFQSPGVPLNIVCPSRRLLAPRTRIVLDFVREELRQVQAMLAATSNEVCIT